jgi:BASS family bile acid:Na+ symporter
MLALIGNGTLLGIIAFLVIGLAVGHLLGGPAPNDRTVLALATATRHPAVAVAIAQIVFPAEKAVLATTLLYMLVGLAVTLPYVAWRKKSLTETGIPVARPTPVL